MLRCVADSCHSCHSGPSGSRENRYFVPAVEDSGYVNNNLPIYPEPFKLTHESVDATATQYMQKAAVDSRILEPKLGPTTYGVAMLRAISSPARSIQDG